MKADEKRARLAVHRRSGSICEACGMRPASEWHHRVPRSCLGRWSAANGMHLCRIDHAWITEHPKLANHLGQHLYSWQDPAASPVKLFAHGWVLLDDAGGLSPTSPPNDPRRAAA